MLKINYVMEERGVTQTQLARLIGKQQPTISLYVNGKQNPRAKARRLIARALRWPEERADELFEEDR